MAKKEEHVKVSVTQGDKALLKQEIEHYGRSWADKCENEFRESGWANPLQAEEVILKMFVHILRPVKSNWGVLEKTVRWSPLNSKEWIEKWTVIMRVPFRSNRKSSSIDRLDVGKMMVASMKVGEMKIKEWIWKTFRKKNQWNLIVW